MLPHKQLCGGTWAQRLKLMSDLCDPRSMDCLRCGTNIGDQLGLCPSCKAERAAPQLQVTGKNGATAPRLTLMSLLGQHPTLLSVLVLLPIGLFLLRSTFVDEPTSFTMRGGQLMLESPDGTSQILYTRGALTRLSGRVFDYDVSRFGFRQGAFGGMLTYLTDEEYQEFLAVPGCKAGYLNSHVKLLLVVPHSEQSREKQKALKLKRGDKFEMQFAQLSPTHIRVEGHEFPASAWYPNNKLILMESIRRR
jgi:hypothetical protein